jgi:predicted Ser/Thr protein kinase
MQFTDKELSRMHDLVYLRIYEDGSKAVVKFIEHNQARLGQEFRIMKALEGIIKVPQVYEYHEIDKIFYGDRFTEMIIMEYIPGSTLRKFTDREEAKRVALQMLDLVEKMHSAGYYHGDLHIGNFIWDGNSLTLIDFGYAYSAEFHKNVKQETFQPSYEHAKTLCKEIPCRNFLVSLYDDWDDYIDYELETLTECIFYLLGEEEEYIKTIEELRDIVQGW